MKVDRRNLLFFGGGLFLLLGVTLSIVLLSRCRYREAIEVPGVLWKDDVVHVFFEVTGSVEAGSRLSSLLGYGHAAPVSRTSVWVTFRRGEKPIKRQYENYRRMIRPLPLGDEIYVAVYNEHAWHLLESGWEPADQRALETIAGIDTFSKYTAETGWRFFGDMEWSDSLGRNGENRWPVCVDLVDGKLRIEFTKTSTGGTDEYVATVFRSQDGRKDSKSTVALGSARSGINWISDRQRTELIRRPRSPGFDR